jgi:WD40 repeat protein
MLGAAAQKLAPGVETRSGLTGVIGSTSFAGTINDVTAAVYGRGGILVTRGTDGTVSLWNATDRAQPRRLSTLRDAASASGVLTFSPDRRLLALADAQDKAVLYDIADPSGPVRLGPLPTDGEVTAISFGGNGKMIAVGDGLGFTTLWDLADPAQPDRLITLTEWGSHAVQNLAFSPDARLLIANKTRFVPVYDLTDRRKPKVVTSLPSFMVGPIMFLPGGSTVLSGDFHGTVNFYDLAEEWPEEMMHDLGGLSGTVRALTLSDDARLMAAADGDGTALVWDLSNVEGARVITAVRAPAGINTVSFDATADTLVTTDSTRTATLWSVPSRGAPDRLAVRTDPAAVVEAAAFHADGRSLVAAQESGKAHLWDVTDPARPVRGRDLTLHAGPVRSVAFSPDGRTAAAAGQLDGRLTLTDLTRPERPVQLAVLTGFVAAPYKLVFSSDGRTLAVITSTSVTLWDLTTGTRPRLLTTLSGGVSFGLGAAFSPDGRTLVTSGADLTLTVWNVADRAVPVRLASLAGHSDYVVSVAFSPDGRTVASGSADSTAMLWDLTDRARPHRLATLTGHPAGLATVAFSPDGRTLATGDKDYALILWDTANPVAPIRLTTVRGLVGAAVEVLFRPDGHTLAVAAQHGEEGATVSLWNARKLKNLRADPAKYACAITRRGLTAGEWARYVPEFPYQRSCA